MDEGAQAWVNASIARVKITGSHESLRIMGLLRVVKQITLERQVNDRLISRRLTMQKKVLKVKTESAANQPGLNRSVFGETFY